MRGREERVRDRVVPRRYVREPEVVYLKKRMLPRASVIQIPLAPVDYDRSERSEDVLPVVEGEKEESGPSTRRQIAEVRRLEVRRGRSCKVVD